MRRLIVCGVIGSYLLMLGFGLFSHALGYKSTSHVGMYFLVWDMYCGWGAYETRSHVIAVGESGQYYEITPPPWGEFVPFGSAERHTYDSSASFTGILTAHVLEHTANPILALSEWIRLLKDQGTLVLVLPHKDKTFDHRRPVTTLDHLIDDFKVGMAEDDLTHLPEILALHDLVRDPEAGDRATFKSRCLRNFDNRCLHHHVFDAQLAVDLAEYVGLKIQSVEEISPHHILLLAQKM